MEQFVKFLKGFGLIAVFMMIVIAGINCVIYSPYVFLKICGLVTIAVAAYEIINRLKKGV